MYNVQLAVKKQLIYCTICTIYTQLHVSAYFRPSSGCFLYPREWGVLQANYIT